jgi:hypothetical protein
MRRTVRVVTAAVTIVGTVALTAGCGSSKSNTGSKPNRTGAGSSATATTTTPGGQGAAGTAATGGAATGGATGGPTGSANPAAAQGACPVATDVLMAALRSNAKLYSALAHPNEVKNPHCASGYAVATTVPVAQVEPALVVYAFDAKVGAWRAMNAGTDSVCEGTVPANIAKLLPGC